MKTKIDMKMMHGYSGGLIISSICLLLLITACSQNSIKCQYKFRSLSIGNEERKDYYLTIEEYKNGYRFNYSEISDSIDHCYEVDYDKNTLRLVDNIGSDRIAILVGEKKYELNGNSLSVMCYWPNDENILAENLLLFYNQNYGVFLMKFTSAITELTYFEGHTKTIKSLINKIKSDSVFYNYGGRKIASPPS
jgi:hypothetical protein